MLKYSKIVNMIFYLSENLKIVYTTAKLLYVVHRLHSNLVKMNKQKHETISRSLQCATEKATLMYLH